MPRTSSSSPSWLTGLLRQPWAGVGRGSTPFRTLQPFAAVRVDPARQRIEEPLGLFLIGHGNRPEVRKRSQTWRYCSRSCPARCVVDPPGLRVAPDAPRR